MKYILMLMISFSAMADDIYEADLKGFLASAKADVKQLTRINGEIMEISQGLMIQNASLMVKLKKESKLSNSYKLYLENISEMCLGGNNFVSIGSDGSVYRFSCDLVEVLK